MKLAARGPAAQCAEALHHLQGALVSPATWGWTQDQCPSLPKPTMDSTTTRMATGMAGVIPGGSKASFLRLVRGQVTRIFLQALPPHVGSFLITLFLPPTPKPIRLQCRTASPACANSRGVQLWALDKSVNRKGEAAEHQRIQM